MTNYDFLGKAKYFVPLSAVLVLLSYVLMLTVGLNPGVDFTGGTQFTVYFSKAVPVSEVRSLLSSIPTEGVDLSRSQIQDIRGKQGVIITIPLDVEAHKELVDRIEKALRDYPATTEVSRISIGGQVSRELVNRAWQAILIAILAILVYISWRFKLRYAVGAIVALIHDVSIALGVFSLLHVPINLPAIAAFLTIFGYSLNDTIVIFDRIRENLKLMRKTPIFDVINKSVNQTLSRTINTSLTTFIPVLILYVLGGPSLRPFALALLIGVIVGTYSSMYIANPILYWWTMAADRAKEKGRARRARV
jgi:preprotein translocase subunit SecF